MFGTLHTDMPHGGTSGHSGKSAAYVRAIAFFDVMGETDPPKKAFHAVAAAQWMKLHDRFIPGKPMTMRDKCWAGMSSREVNTFFTTRGDSRPKDYDTVLASVKASMKADAERIINGSFDPIPVWEWGTENDPKSEGATSTTKRTDCIVGIKGWTEPTDDMKAAMVEMAERIIG